MEALAIVISACAFLSIMVGVLSLLRYGFWSADQRPEACDRIQVGFLVAAVVLFIIIIAVIGVTL